MLSTSRGSDFASYPQKSSPQLAQTRNPALWAPPVGVSFGAGDLERVQALLAIRRCHARQIIVVAHEYHHAPTLCHPAPLVHTYEGLASKYAYSARYPHR
jgi:hypothetical protein